MSKVLLDKAVSDINGYLADLSKGNNECAKDVVPEWSLEWLQVRMAAMIPIDVYQRAHMARYNFIEDELPDGTTHMIMVGIQHWDSDQPNILRCMSGQIFTAGVYSNGTICMEDVEECLGGGPSLTDSSMDECLDWIRELGGEVSMYYDLVNEFGTEIPIPDSGYPSK